MAFKLEASLDPLEMDRYIDFDQEVYPSPSTSSSASSRGKAIATPEFRVETPTNTFVSPHQSSQTGFAAPSFQYGNYKQQTGLPVGALANTLAVNQSNTFGFAGGYSSGSLIPPIDAYYPFNTNDDVFDFNTLPSHNPSFGGSADMDMDFDSPVSGLFTPTLNQSSSTDFVDPNAIGGQEDPSPSSTSVQASVPKLWPGMHQQQAAIAKAQAQQRQQQQVKTVQPQAVPSQRPAGTKAPSSTSRPATDPVVEERISRLLNQMRQNSVASSQNDAQTPNANSQSHLARQKKDEEDMDEDERLLASEEGRKLSSKERRQLRNKVSARAFRSRRKEYIGQLEGEIAAKAQEADDLRSDNEALKAENTRLTDLTRMLLSSSAFSSFLNDLSSNGSTLAAAAPAPTPTLSSSSNLQQSQPIRKDANPHQRQHQSSSQNGTQVGMTLVPDTTMDYSVFNSTTNAWAGNMDFGFNNAQVFSVTELPQGPAIDSIDIGLLSGKSSNTVGPYSSDDAKDDVPSIEHMPTISVESKIIPVAETPCDDVDFDASNPAYALFIDTPISITPQPSEAVASEPEYRVFGGIDPEKAFARLDLVVDDETSSSDGVVSSVVMARFEQICSEMEAASSRVATITAHL